MCHCLVVRAGKAEGYNVGAHVRPGHQRRPTSRLARQVRARTYVVDGRVLLTAPATVARRPSTLTVHIVRKQPIVVADVAKCCKQSQTTVAF